MHARTNPRIHLCASKNMLCLILNYPEKPKPRMTSEY
jgi:hypothetical protein